MSGSGSFRCKVMVRVADEGWGYGSTSTEGRGGRRPRLLVFERRQQRRHAGQQAVEAGQQLRRKRRVRQRQHRQQAQHLDLEHD